MNWKCKAALQAIFSRVYGGEALNHLCQRYVTKRFPIPDGEFKEMVQVAKQHVDALGRHRGAPLRDLTFYEFGAGWDLIVPLSLYSLGVDSQILTDIRRLSRASLIHHTTTRLHQLNLMRGALREPAPFPTTTRQPVQLLQRLYGIDYRAPCDAADTGLPTGSVDCITSTHVLEHIPAADIPAVLRECHRLLRGGGLISFQIDYADHYSYFDASISPYNFLRYSEHGWSRFSPSLHYQNRLRHRDYMEFIRRAGFKVLEEERFGGTAADVATIARLPVHDSFRRYTHAELSVRAASVVLCNQ